MFSCCVQATVLVPGIVLDTSDKADKNQVLFLMEQKSSGRDKTVGKAAGRKYQTQAGWRQRDILPSSGGGARDSLRWGHLRGREGEDMHLLGEKY